jgi:hypothetical protein
LVAKQGLKYKSWAIWPPLTHNRFTKTFKIKCSLEFKFVKASNEGNELLKRIEKEKIMICKIWQEFQGRHNGL